MVIISHIAITKTYEKFFKHTFSVEKSELKEQDFMKKLAKMPRVVLIQTIKQNL